MNAIEILTSQHREVEGLFAKANKEDKALVREIKEKLRLHALIEEEYFYPEIGKYPELVTFLRDVKQEHDRVRELVTDWAASTGLQYENIGKELMDTVNHHVQEEEKEMFPEVQRVVPKEVLTELGKRMKTEIPA